MSTIDEKLTLANENVPKVYAAGGASIDLSNYVQKTDYAGQNRAGLVKIAINLSQTAIEMDESNYITIIPANPGEIMGRLTNKPITPQNMNYAVKSALSDSQRISDMTVEEKANARKVINAVGFTDYAKETGQAGIVSIGTDVTPFGVGPKGVLQLAVVSTNEIDNRNNMHMWDNFPLGLGNLDYAVRSVHPITSNSIPDTLAVNTIYGLGIESTLTINLPSIESPIATGDFIQVDFYSGKTPTNLTVTFTGGSLSDINLNPEANTMYSLYFDWGLVYCHTTEAGAVLQEPGWRFSYAEYPHKEV